MKRLIAVFPILFENRNYKPGDELPTHNNGFVKEWLKNRTAIWQDDEKSRKQSVKAKPVTATSGLSGKSSFGLGEDLVGKPPSRRKFHAEKNF